MLAEQLAYYRDRPDLLVSPLRAGVVVVGFEVACALQAPLQACGTRNFHRHMNEVRELPEQARRALTLNENRG